MISRVDEYLHTVPLSGAEAEEVGPFTLFRSTTVWPYYARPRAGVTVTAADVQAVRARCAELDLPLSFEWVVDACPTLGPAATEAGLTAHEYPLLVLDPADLKTVATDARVEILRADADLVRLSRAVQSIGFTAGGTAVGAGGPAERDAAVPEVPAATVEGVVDRMRRGVTVTGAVFTEDGMVAAGAHQQVGATSEIVGVATLPAMRRRGLAAALTAALAQHAFDNGVELLLLSAESDAVAAVYERVGFRRIGQAGAAE
ncbi:GNAT family N-acetyltransferase [Kribbella sandramycini]|uniref:Ribosomal protein S18 acetylase RimI-like enzyme n=1 Tax=Kribbella sandramycini TaxID=60450 RepID=A0A841S530_9ACTN|nr:ribosomal protein S18 acetylase RimI-like enzyme [Kribbella sandramycini]